MLKAEDILRLDAELETIFSDSDTWMKINDIDFSVVDCVANSGFVALTDKLLDGSSYEQALGETIANAFVIGWEAFRQYGERKNHD
jgi:hypothetical protein